MNIPHTHRSEIALKCVVSFPGNWDERGRGHLFGCFVSASSHSWQLCGPVSIIYKMKTHKNSVWILTASLAIIHANTQAYIHLSVPI